MSETTQTATGAATPAPETKPLTKIVVRKLDRNEATRPCIQRD